MNDSQSLKAGLHKLCFKAVHWFITFGDLWETDSIKNGQKSMLQRLQRYPESSNKDLGSYTSQNCDLIASFIKTSLLGKTRSLSRRHSFHRLSSTLHDWVWHVKLIESPFLNVSYCQMPHSVINILMSQVMKSLAWHTHTCATVCEEC